MRHFSTRQQRSLALALAAGSAAVLVTLGFFAGAGEARPASPPSNSTAPSIRGDAREGNTLTANLGKWRGSQPITYAGQWTRCNSSGGGCVVIPQAVSADYRLTGEDVGRRLRVTVFARNRDGQASATSAATDVVRAAPATAPTQTAAPTVSGTPQEGQVLTGETGQWGGTQPITFAYQWQRCDRTGANCASIVGAAGRTYTLSSADVNNTVRMRIVATNRAGQTTAYSRPSGVVSAKGPTLPPGAVRLADGKYSIPVTSVALPDRLLISGLEFQPNPLRSRLELITARFRVTDTRGYVIRDALVFAIPLPYGWTTQPGETTTGQDGWATVQMRATKSMPRKGAIVMFVRARKGGDSVLAGISTRRLVQMLVNIR